MRESDRRSPRFGSRNIPDELRQIIDKAIERARPEVVQNLIETLDEKKLRREEGRHEQEKSKP